MAGFSRSTKPLAQAMQSRALSLPLASIAVRCAQPIGPLPLGVLLVEHDLPAFAVCSSLGDSPNLWRPRLRQSFGERNALPFDPVVTGVLGARAVRWYTASWSVRSWSTTRGAPTGRSRPFWSCKGRKRELFVRRAVHQDRVEVPLEVVDEYLSPHYR